MSEIDPPRDGDVSPESRSEQAILTPKSPPEHGPEFWSDVERSLAAESASAARGSCSARTHPLFHDTGPLPSVEVPAAPTQANVAGTRTRSLAMLALAATAVVLVGVGVIALRGGDRGSSVTTDLAVDAPADAAPALDGSDDAGSGETPVSEPGPTGAEDPSPAAVDGAAGPVTATPVEVIPAVGADTATTIYPAKDGDLPGDARFLATWEARRLSWYSVADATKSCTELDHAEIRYVNESGITQAVHSPQVGFSGEISHFTLDATEPRAGWLVSCGTQLEFYVADMASSGEIEDLKLVWFGEGDPEGALIVWKGSMASLNIVDPDGDPAFVEFDTRTELASGTGINPAPSEPGSPPGRGSIPLAASGDAVFSYWNAPTRSFTDAAPDTDSCDAEALWVRQPGPRWTVALAGELELRTIDVLALSTDASRIAFADSCGGRDGRLFVGVPGGDGLIRDVRSVDLSPYVPGFADRLFWVDDSTVRIETDNRTLGVDRVTFDYRLGDGNEPGILLQLD